MTPSVTQHIYLSPHFDDASLSCGAQISDQVAAGLSVTVATIFAGKPDYTQLSPFAQEIHARPHAGTDPITQRREEESKAMELLGATERPGLYLDCIYRRDREHSRWLYTTEESLFGQVDVEDDDLVEELAQAFAALAPAISQSVVYAPLAIGNHVDHQVVHRAARVLQKEGYTVRYYEDYPYVVRDLDGLPKALENWADGGRWVPELVQVSENALKRKISAVGCYRSQIDVLFPNEVHADADRVSIALRSYAGQLAKSGPPAERIWHLISPESLYPVRRSSLSRPDSPPSGDAREIAPAGAVESAARPVESGADAAEAPAGQEHEHESDQRSWWQALADRLRSFWGS